MMSDLLEKTYSPKAVEDRIYGFWEREELFRPEANPAAETPFSIVIPPPNVTGVLHMGHALDNTLQDILIRWHRMRGDKTLWMPGTDHAGIATQNVVERQLREKGLTKFDLGREAFLKEVWDWAMARKGDIVSQFKRLGISPDWHRERFTLDKGLSKSVRKAFVTLYEQGLIYRGTYIVNWCPRCTSAISDIETDYVEQESFLWEISYPLKDGHGAMVVATTRPETMFGDVAVAVNPDDPRYKSFIGKTVILPLANVEIPVIADNYVDTNFGTGALKITPAHDANDFEVAGRHKLEPVWIMDEKGILKADARIPEVIQGLDREAARKKTEAMLEEHGFLVKKTPHTHSVGHCQRCATTIEPLLSKQWFVRSKPLAEKALKSLDAGEIQFLPERWTKIYRDWMENIRDWCISRQLWWGHQIPAWYCHDCDEMIVAMEAPTNCPKCGSGKLVQETDVLDTWFSSGLWPFSTMGWPDLNASDFKTFYPTSVLVTGFDIIFFWVARMTMLGLALTDKSPFQRVYIHGLIRDEKGQKMSKSKGNTIDPVEIIDEYGCDALRFSLTSLVTGGQDIKLSKDSFDQGKLFANKLWNASRFVLMNLEGVDDQPIDIENLSAMDKWVLGELHSVVIGINESLENYRFSDAAEHLYQFIWNTFCDWYVEYSKKQLRDEITKANTQRILLFVLDQTLRLFHPVMPHITEEIWQKLPHRTGKAIMISQYPQASSLPIQETSKDIPEVIKAIRVMRETRQSSGVPHSQETPVDVQNPDDMVRQALDANIAVIQHFVKAIPLTSTSVISLSLPPNSVTGPLGKGRVVVTLESIDQEAEISRLQKIRDRLQKEYDDLAARLQNPGFIDKAPANVVANSRELQAGVRKQIEMIDARLSALAR